MAVLKRWDGTKWAPVAGVIAGSTSAVKTGIYPFELPNASTTFSANQGFNMRRFFQLNRTITKFRIHIENRNQLADTRPAGLSNIGVAIGLPASDGTSGQYNGNFTAAPTTLASAGSHTAGNEYVTPWIVPATFTLAPFKDYLLSIGYTLPSGTVCFGGGFSWQTYAAGDYSTQTTNPTRAPNNAHLVTWIEYQYADVADNSGVPSMLVVGNSLSNGSNGGSVDNAGEASSWPQVWARRNSGVAANLAVGGAYASTFVGANNRWNIYNSCEVAFDPDIVLYFAANSSDLAGGTGTAQNIADAKTAQINMVAKGKSLYPNARHIITNIPPRIAFTGSGATAGTLEKSRLDVNKWLHTLPGGVEMCVDVDGVLSNRADPGRLLPAYNADDTHLSMQGHNAAAAVIPGIRG